MSGFFEWTESDGKKIDLNHGLDTDNAQHGENYKFLGYG